MPGSANAITESEWIHKVYITVNPVLYLLAHPVRLIFTGPEPELGWHEGTLEEGGLLRHDPHDPAAWVQGETDGVLEVEEGGTGGENCTKLLHLMRRE